MTPTPSNGRPPGHPGRPADTPEPADGLADPLAEAEEIRKLLAEAGTRLSRLVVGLKQFRRHSRAVRQAVASLKHLDLGG